MRLEPGTVLRDKYQIVRKVDEAEKDDVGEVFEARHLDLAGRYAIKFLCEGGIRNALLLDDLRREALATTALSHPGIVRVYDLDQAPDGSPFLVMEFLNGQSLARVIRESGPLALSDVAVIVEAIASPLGEAHRRGIVHGDLTPGNVFVLDAEADPHARVKLLDFGVARIRSQAGGIIRGSGAVGPSAYHAPEQQQGRTWEIDERADVFSLGAIAHALSTGRAPVIAGTGSAAGAAPSAAPPAVAAVIARAMTPHREGRFRTAGDFARALRAAVVTSPARSSGIRATGARASRLGATPAVPVATLHAQTERVRKPAGMLRLLAAAIGCGVAIMVGVVVMTKPPRAPRPAARPAAVARPVAPPQMPAAPPVPVTPPAPAPAAASTDRARQPLPLREDCGGEGRRQRRSPHAGMTEDARREMEQSYQKASRAFDLGNYDEAIAAYKRTYELGGDAPMLYNIAQALRLAKRPDEAAGYYRRYLERAPKAPNRDEVIAKLADVAVTPAKPTESPPKPDSPTKPVAPVVASPAPLTCQWPGLAAAGKGIDVSCVDLDAKALVTKVLLSYRATGASGFSVAEMVKGASGWKGSIPPSAVTPKGLEVYFEGRRASGEAAVQNGSASRPNTISVAQP